MKTPLCHVVGAGDFAPHLLEKKEGDFVIAADAGYRHLTETGLVPDLYVGDGDSLLFTPEKLDSVVLPSVKDDTDTLAALREGLRLGYRDFRLYGALGGKRFSHSLANLQALTFLAENGAKGQILDENATVSLLVEGIHSLDAEGGYFSLFAMESEAVISIEGAKYPLSFATLTPNFPLGVSNEGTKSTLVTVHSGRVFLVRET